MLTSMQDSCSHRWIGSMLPYKVARSEHGSRGRTRSRMSPPTFLQGNFPTANKQKQDQYDLLLHHFVFKNWKKSVIFIIMFLKLYISRQVSSRSKLQQKSSASKIVPVFWENKDEGEAQRFEARSAHLAWSPVCSVPSQPHFFVRLIPALFLFFSCVLTVFRREVASAVYRDCWWHIAWRRHEMERIAQEERDAEKWVKDFDVGQGPVSRMKDVFWSHINAIAKTIDEHPLSVQQDGSSLRRQKFAGIVATVGFSFVSLVLPLVFICCSEESGRFGRRSPTAEQWNCFFPIDGKACQTRYWMLQKLRPCSCSDAGSELCFYLFVWRWWKQLHMLCSASWITTPLAISMKVSIMTQRSTMH